MNREPIALYLFRLLMSVMLLTFIGMLYWSSLLIEERLNALFNEVSALKKNLAEWQRNESAAERSAIDPPLRLNGSKKLSLIDADLPNLLTEDPFYATTLPGLLGKDFSPKGYFQETSLGRPHNLHPFSNWSQVSAWNNDCSMSLAKLAFGKYDEFCPEMALKIEARQRKDYSSPHALEFWIHLRDDIFWQPLKLEFFTENIQLAQTYLEKQRVTAEDFLFYYNALMNPHVEEAGAVALRTYYNDIESVEVIDHQTLVVRWKVHPFTDPSTGNTIETIKYAAFQLTAGLKPLPRHVFQYYADGSKILDEEVSPTTYRTNSIWAQNFSNHWARNIIISCGPWIFDGMNEREIRFVRNQDYPERLRVLVEGAVIHFKDTPEASWQSFKSNKTDSYNLQPDQLAELSHFMSSERYRRLADQGKRIERLDYLANIYNYIGWNQANPLFASKKVRQALTMAIDRKRIIEQNLNGLGIEISCPFYRYSTSYDDSIEPWPYDLAQARLQLEEEGWYDSNEDGIIEKVIDGKIVSFQFKLTYYVKNTISKSICEYVATNLKEVGIECNLNGVDIADLSSSFEDKSFDAISLGWALGNPPEDPYQLWHSSGAFEKGSSNAIGFADPEADNIIDALQYEKNPAERKKLYFRFDAIIHDSASYTFLYTPKVVFLYQSYLQNVFIPKDRQDLIPGATVGQPDSSAFWIKQ